MRVGKVYLVGAGPGDPGLLTVRGLELLHVAQVIVYDQLVNPVLLEEAPPVAIKIFVGKEAGRHCVAQEEINEVLIGYARLGRKVVRLKGGDPFVFGRGGEEAEALAEAGVPFEVVPGVSSAVAVPAYAGIPLTHRKFSSSFAVVTGHEARKAQRSVDWSRLAKAVDTLVILMGLKNLPQITAELLTHGLSPTTPVAVIRWGTTEAQETVTAPLADIAVKAAHMKSPAVIVVGRVVELQSRLDWFLPGMKFTGETWSLCEEEHVNMWENWRPQSWKQLQTIPAIGRPGVSHHHRRGDQQHRRRRHDPVTAIPASSKRDVASEVRSR